MRVFEITTEAGKGGKRGRFEFVYVHVRVEGKGTNGRFEKYCSLQVVAYEDTSLIVHVKAAFPLEQLFVSFYKASFRIRLKEKSSICFINCCSKFQ